MSVLPIKIYGSEVLKEKAEIVEGLDDEVRRLIRDLRDSLYYHQGAGLAANQVGIPRQVFVVDQGKGLIVCINPRIVAVEGKVGGEEGCLSLPGIFVDIERAASLQLEYRDENWEPRKLEAEGQLARIIQHETDHLAGVVIADRAGFVTRKMIGGKLRKLQKRVEESL